ncbi:DUF4283 domain protein [Trifolium medium]|uniref:DUF4283 domain protein n=1 Tax=Trifolium medium TaxID=97028 RepID=A0A392Q7S7_9FABA|nr:DUF4283 domain protein [Trifolium medium]
MPEELKPWSPNQVCSRRRIWLRMFGVPLHAWGERTFKNISNRCGEFVCLDTETLNRSHFDMARVRIETALLGFIDFVIKLRFQASSCNSSGCRPAFAVLEGLGDDNSDCGASERCQQEVVESTGGIGILENNGAKSLCVAVHGVDIPSNVEKEMETEETFE